MHLADFQYALPDEQIAQVPIEPRDASRLLLTSDNSDHPFTDLSRLLDPGDLVVVNDTRVRHARLIGNKSGTGGAVEVLLLGALADGRWEGLFRPARRIHAGTELEFGNISATVVTEPVDGRALLEMASSEDIEVAIEDVGAVPLPPYITTELTDRGRYQTIFADQTGSAAAPTAGLHFTDRVIAGLAARGIRMTTVELQVGLATFRPITVPEIEEHRMHEERFSVSESTADLVTATRAHGGRVVAIGTTVVRALESVGNADGTIEAGSGSTDLYLMPGARFNVVDRLVTNFHMSGSSLLVLLAAFMGSRWRESYTVALDRGYRFLSFGDAMLCDRA